MNQSVQASHFPKATFEGRSRLPTRRLIVRCDSTRNGGAAASRAVVIGAGLAGLTAAKALSPFFDSVTVLERDAWTANVAEGTDHRPGVPQFQQPHVLLSRGLQALNSLLGDFSGALREAGGQPVCFTNDFYFYDYGMSFLRGDSDVRGVLSTRALVEQTVRTMVTAQSGISLRAGAPVSSLVFDEEKKVSGVLLKDGSHLDADLVVDASGRSSRASDWLAAGGLHEPQQLMVDAKLAYATRLYTRPEGYAGPPAALVGGRPMGTRGAVLIPVEGNRWQLILGGYAGDHPPADEEGFAAFIDSLGSNRVAEMLKGAQALTPVSRYMGTRNFRRLYEEVDMPPGFVVMGDAVCAFNPIYGQGITVGVLESEALRDMLEERWKASGGDLQAALRGLPNDFQRLVAEIVRMPWQLAISEDSKWSVAESNYKVPQTAALLRPYFGAVARAAAQDTSVYKEYVQIMHMMKDPSAFFSPFMALKALQYSVLMPLLARLPLVGARFTGPAGGAGEPATAAAAAAK